MQPALERRKNKTFISEEWFYIPDFHRGTLRCEFSRGTETGCLKDSGHFHTQRTILGIKPKREHIFI